MSAGRLSVSTQLLGRKVELFVVMVVTLYLLLLKNSCFAGMLELDEYTMERVMEEFEQRCYDNMNHAIETEEGLGIEYDEDVVCDVCQSPDGEDGNEMVFCDKCNICVHQVRQQQGVGGVTETFPKGQSVGTQLGFIPGNLTESCAEEALLCATVLLQKFS